MLVCRSGEPIYAQGEPAHALYAVLAGAVRTVRHSRDGRRQIGAFYYPGDLFGLAADDEHDFAAEAICPTRIMTFERSSGDDEATVAAALCELSRAHAHLAMIGRRSAEEKVASFLVDMARRGASDLTSLPMSRQDMADYLGLALETVSRVLSRFKDEGLVAFSSSRDFHIVRGAALNRLAET
jgi:CRP/FNR family nitrogen fixation transcriptional regulator